MEKPQLFLEVKNKTKTLYTFFCSYGVEVNGGNRLQYMEFYFPGSSFRRYPNALFSRGGKSELTRKTKRLLSNRMRVVGLRDRIWWNGCEVSSLTLSHLIHDTKKIWWRPQGFPVAWMLPVKMILSTLSFAKLTLALHFELGRACELNKSYLHNASFC